MRHRRVVQWASAALVGVAVLLAAVQLGTASPHADEPVVRSSGASDAVLVRPDEPVTTVPRAAATTTSTTAAPTTTAPPTTTTTTAPPPKFTVEPYEGLGAWLDVYDWTSIHGGSAVGAEAVDVLAAQGVQTLFIQASKWDSHTNVIEPDRLHAIIDRAHHHGIAVVGWYLPALEDPGRDLLRILEIAALPIEGLAIDIEGRSVGDVAERNRRLVWLSQQIDAWLPREVIGAIPLEPVLMEDVNPSYWPGYPWAELAPHYDVWLPMGYWTNRRGGWRDAYTYTAANIDRVRERIGQPTAPVHALGGIGDLTTPEDLVGFRNAATERGAIGGSIYDFRTTQGPHWPELLPFRDLTG